jgi:hypothetical protein
LGKEYRIVRSAAKTKDYFVLEGRRERRVMQIFGFEKKETFWQYENMYETLKEARSAKKRYENQGVINE